MSGITSSEPDYGTGKKKASIYVIGIFICIILTLIPFFAVIYQRFSHPVIFVIIFSSAILQFLTQVICFLRLNAKTTQSKVNLMAFIFTIIVLVVIVGGSLWIMWQLKYYMMH